MKKARAGISAHKFAGKIIANTFLSCFFLVLFALWYLAIITEGDDWPFSPWFVFIPTILLFLLIINFLPKVFNTDGEKNKEYVLYDENSIIFFNENAQQWKISKAELEKIEFTPKLIFLKCHIRIMGNESCNYLKKRTALMGYTVKKLSKLGYPIVKVKQL